MHTEAIPDQSLHHDAAVASNTRTPAVEPPEAPIQPVSRAPAQAHTQAAPTTVTQTREAINLRLLLELRRRLKSAAEKELAVGADRMRTLRGILRRAESELRLCARSLETRAQQLGQTANRVEKAEEQAAHTCARLCALEHEHADLAQQLSAAQGNTVGIQLSMGPAGSESKAAREADIARPSSVRPAALAGGRTSAHARSGTLDSFVLATAALMSDLSHAISDQASLRGRGRDLIEKGESCAARARAIQTCFHTAHRALTAMSDEIQTALDGLRG